jgi:glycosyltransferase involved in cell wall biosynthesis
MRTYWTAHGLSALGHEVHVVTNAKEAAPPFRMHMREEDWQRCEAMNGIGSVAVHWTDPVDRSQSYLPMASPFVSKLAGVAAAVHSASPLDLVYSHYLEPYGVAGHLAAEMADVPHVVRMAGSDAGRLWHHPQLEALYDHVLRSAAVVIAGDTVAERAIARGVEPRRIAVGGGYRVPPGLFTPVGPRLDFGRLKAEIREGSGELRDTLWGELPGGLPYFGVFGKLGEQKGSFALLAAMQRLKQAGIDVGLVALAHGRSDIERRFRGRVQELGLADRVLQIPFIPHWRVPEFLRGCLAVCCLEQDFPIGFHAPIVPREVLLCGTCLVASTEVIHKLPHWEQLPHGYGCVAIENVNDVAELGERLAAVAVEPSLTADVGRRGRDFALKLQERIDFPDWLDRIVVAASRTRSLPSRLRYTPHPLPEESGQGRFRLTQLAVAAMERAGRPAARRRGKQPGRPIDLAKAQQVLVKLERAIERGNAAFRPLARAVQVEIAVALAENAINASPRMVNRDPLFRIDAAKWAIADDDIADLVPIRNPDIRILHFEFDVSAFRRAFLDSKLPATLNCRPSYMVVFGSCDNTSREPLVIDAQTARILQLSDGNRTIREILLQLEDASDRTTVAKGPNWMEELFIRDLIQFGGGKGGVILQQSPTGLGTTGIE